MARPRATRRISTKKNFHCSKCSFKTTGPTGLSEHYKRYPSHRKEKIRQGISTNGQVLPFPQVSITRRRKALEINFCPRCGQDLRGSS